METRPTLTTRQRGLKRPGATLGELEAGFAKSIAPDTAREQPAVVFQVVTVVPFDETALTPE